jgi:peptide/nickel transport system substrate-binding protein
MIYRTHAVKALTAIGAVILMAGCGSSGGSGGSSTGGTGGTASGPVHGGNLVFAAVKDPESMNATTVFDNNSIWIFEQIFEQLYTVTNNGKGVMPWLATSYKVSADKKAYTFTLRPGVKFSNGKPMTSADVKFSIDQNTKAAAGWGFINTAIKSVSAPAPETVVVHLKYPWAPLLADLSIFANGIVPNNYGGETEAQFYTHPIGTGPFKWAFWHKGSALKLVRNPFYWQKGKPYLNSITWTDVPNQNTRQLQLKGGQAQIDQTPAWSTVASLKATQGVNMHLFNSTQTNYLAFNELRKPLQDVHVRRAISLAGQGRAVRQRQAGQLAVPAAGAVLPGGHAWPAVQRGRREAGDGQVQRPARLLDVDPDPGGQLRRPDGRHHPAVRAQAVGHQPQDPATGPERGPHRPAGPQVRHDAHAVDDGHRRPGRIGHLRR